MNEWRCTRLKWVDPPQVHGLSGHYEGTWETDTHKITAKGGSLRSLRRAVKKCIRASEPIKQ